MSGGYRCPLGGLLPSGMDVEKVKREGWREQKILVVHADDPRLDWFSRELVKQLGNQLYGEGK